LCSNQLDLMDRTVCTRIDRMAAWLSTIPCQQRRQTCEHCTPHLPWRDNLVEVATEIIPKEGPFWDNLVELGAYFWQYGLKVKKRMPRPVQPSHTTGLSRLNPKP